MGKSVRLRLSDVRNVFRLLNEIQAAKISNVAIKQRMVNRLCRLVGARQGNAFSWAGFSPAGRLRLLDAVPGGWASPEAAVVWQQLMREDSWNGDPILNRAVQIGGPVRTFLQEQLVSCDAWERSAVRNDVARHVGVDECLVAWYRCGGADQVEGISLQRGWNDPAFGLRERNIVHLFNVEMARLYRSGKLRLAPDDRPNLSPRRQEVLDALLTGDAEKQVALKLGLSPLTVNDHVKAIYRHYSVNSRGELMARFIRKPD